MKRETLFKIIIIAISVLLFFIASGSLIYFGKIHFTWSDRIMNKIKFNESKSMKKRILILGDSQLETWPLEHCLAKDIESFCLDNNIGCINTAHYGFGPIEYLDRAITIAPEYKPDLILLFYYTGNDLTDVLYRSDFSPKKPTYNSFSVESMEGEKNRKKEEERFQKSKILNPISDEERKKLLTSKDFDWQKFMDYGIDTVLIQYAKNRTLYPNALGSEYVNPWLLVNAVYMPDYLIENTLINTINSRYAWYSVIKYIEKVLLYVKTIDCKICIVSIPNNVQVDSSHFEFYRKLKFNVSPDLLKSNVPQLLLDDFAKYFGITHINLSHILRQASKNNQEMYFLNDDHLSEIGHINAFAGLKNMVLEPYNNGSFMSYVNDNTEKYYLNFTEWAVPFVINKIKNTPDWYNQIIKTAEEENTSLDSALAKNARFAIQNEK